MRARHSDAEDKYISILGPDSGEGEVKIRLEWKRLLQLISVMVDSQERKL